MEGKYNCGIYWIRNKINNKKYIGQTSLELNRRWHDHLSKLRNNSHVNYHLQNSWNKYEETNFEFKVLLCCDFDKLGFFEGLIIKGLQSHIREHGYNLCIPDEDGGFCQSEEAKRKRSIAMSGKGNPMYGKKHSKETKEKLSRALRGENSPWFGRKHSEESKEKIAIGNTNKIVSAETRKKISLANRGRKHSIETRQAMSIAKKGEKNSMYGKRGEDCPNYGKRHTEETKRKISEAQMGEKNHRFGKTLTREEKEHLSRMISGYKHPMYGKKHSKETKAKISRAMKGKKHSPETREKMSKARKRNSKKIN